MNRYTEPDFPSSALITIDTQTDTLDGQPLEIRGTSAILPQMRLLLDQYRKQQRPIVHIVRIYKADASNVDLCRRELVEEGAPLLVENGAGTELAEALFAPDAVRLDTELLLSGGIQKISPFEVIIYKARWGAFFQTPLEQHLREQDVNTLVFTGCNYPNCPRTSIYEASERDFKIVLVEDAISGLYPKGKEEMQNIGVRLMQVEDVIQAGNEAQ
jgi:nicotinamidase-related amidase